MCPRCNADPCSCNLKTDKLNHDDYVYIRGNAEHAKCIRCEYRYDHSRCNFPISNFEGRKLCQWHAHWVRILEDADDDLKAESTEFDAWWGWRKLEKWFGKTKEEAWARLHTPNTKGVLSAHHSAKS